MQRKYIREGFAKQDFDEYLISAVHARNGLLRPEQEDEIWRRER